MNQDNPEPGVAHLLRSAAKRRKQAAGAEPHDLEAVARWFDGDLATEERARIASRIEADPELAATVSALRQHDLRGSEAGTRMAPLPSNVISLSDRARRPPEKRPSPARKILIGTGSVLAIAAVVFLTTRPAVESTSNTHGASVIGASATRLTATYAGASGCEVAGALSSSQSMTLWYVGGGGATSLGEHAPGPFRVTPGCGTRPGGAADSADSSGRCEVIIATPVGATAPAIDPMTCAPGDATHPGARLQR